MPKLLKAHTINFEKGQEAENLSKLMLFYSNWLNSFKPGMSFKEFMKESDKLCKTRPMKTFWRELCQRRRENPNENLDLSYLNEFYEQQDDKEAEAMGIRIEGNAANDDDFFVVDDNEVETIHDQADGLTPEQREVVERVIDTLAAMEPSSDIESDL